jgi:hypothetical protein
MTTEMKIQQAMKRTGELETAIVMVKALMKGSDNEELIKLLTEAEDELFEVKKELWLVQSMVARSKYAH